tara:strand:+ start:1318 stop:3465 length:2148 start_codon:yes stop_codon:yes gene_type:complete
MFKSKYYVLISFFSVFCFAKEQVYIQEYTYNASELESKQEARQQAKNQAINQVLEKIAVYVKSEITDQLKSVDGKFSEIVELYTQSLTSGQVRTETLEENWDGQNFYIKLKIYADPDKIQDDLKKNAESFSKAGRIHAKERLAIVAFSSAGISDSEINMFITELENELVSYNQYEVIGYQQAIERLKEANSDDVDCISTKCALDLGIDLQVDIVLQPTINYYPNSNKYYLALQMISIVDDGKIRASITEKNLLFPDFLDFLSSINSHILKLVVEDTGKQIQFNQPQTIIGSQVSGGIQINTSPMGALIILDGEEKGKSPLLINDVQPGMHTIVLVLENYNNLTKNIVVKPGMLETVDEMFSKKMGDLYISSNPSGANIFLDGVNKGTTPLSLKYLEIGDYLLEVKYDNYEEYLETVAVEYNYDKKIKVDLDPLPAKVRFFSTPSDAMVYLDGSYIGNTTSSGLLYKVSPGEHTVTMKIDKYYESDDSFNSLAGGNNTIDLTLRKMPKGVSGDVNIGFLSVDVWPKNSKIDINNKSYNSSFSYEEFLKGNYILKFSSEGFQSDSRNIDILPKKHKKVDVTLKQINHSSSKMKSYLFPGLGHFNSEKKLKGTMFMSSAIASLFLLNQSYSEFQDNDKISDAAYQDYVNATTNIQEFAAIYKNAHNKAQDSMTKVLGSAVVLGGVWVWNVLDLKKIIKNHEKIYFDLKMNKIKVEIDF